mmetsp:Transcript_30934/g.87117  ORF Transcript_30934/g.87117 Transcript_30934/m.87117 type:complete len:207 (+) Transcript_30934:312-932(+)
MVKRSPLDSVIPSVGLAGAATAPSACFTGVTVASAFGLARAPNGVSDSASFSTWLKSHPSYSLRVPTTGYLVVKCLYQPARAFCCDASSSSSLKPKKLTSSGFSDTVASENVASLPAQSLPYAPSPGLMFSLEEQLTTFPQTPRHSGFLMPSYSARLESVNSWCSGKTKEPKSGAAPASPLLRLRCQRSASRATAPAASVTTTCGL